MMTFPVVIEPSNGHFAATVIGAPHLFAVRTTRAEAVAALQQQLAQRVERGELLALVVEPAGVSSLAGKYRDDPTLRDICHQAYDDRDGEPNPRPPSTRTF